MGDTPEREPFGLKESYLVSVRLLILWPYPGNGLRLVNKLLCQGWPLALVARKVNNCLTWRLLLGSPNEP